LHSSHSVSVNVFYTKIALRTELFLPYIRIDSSMGIIISLLHFASRILSFSRVQLQVLRQSNSAASGFDLKIRVNNICSASIHYKLCTCPRSSSPNHAPIPRRSSGSDVTVFLNGMPMPSGVVTMLLQRAMETVVLFRVSECLDVLWSRRRLGLSPNRFQIPRRAPGLDVLSTWISRSCRRESSSSSM
jgi:hypothetical protein